MCVWSHLPVVLNNFYCFEIYPFFLFTLSLMFIVLYAVACITYNISIYCSILLWNSFENVVLFLLLSQNSIHIKWKYKEALADNRSYKLCVSNQKLYFLFVLSLFICIYSVCATISMTFYFIFLFFFHNFWLFISFKYWIPNKTVTIYENMYLVGIYIDILCIRRVLHAYIRNIVVKVDRALIFGYVSVNLQRHHQIRRKQKKKQISVIICWPKKKQKKNEQKHK